MDLRKIKKLIDLLEASNLSEIEIKEGEESVRLARAPRAGAPMVAPMHAAAYEAPRAMPMQSPVDGPTGGSGDGGGPALPDGEVIRAPMVGTFYASASPALTCWPSVTNGGLSGDTLGIIEAMKMFNPIEAEVSGTVLKVIAENGQPVEFDEPLFVIG